MCTPSGEIKVSWPEYRPAGRICYPQANGIVRTTARDHQEGTWRNVSDSGRNVGHVAVYADEKLNNVESNRRVGRPGFGTQLDKLSPRRGKRRWREDPGLMKVLAEL